MYFLKPHITPNKEASAFWENFLSEDEINGLLSIPQWLECDEASIGNNTIDKDIRTTDVAWLDFAPEKFSLWERFSSVVSEVNATYFGFDLTGFYEPMQLSVYRSSSNSHYTWHVDYFTGNKEATHAKIPRKLTMTMLLSNPCEFEGGELQIKPNSDEPITLEQKRGRAWFFPSYTLHRVTPVTKGVRRSVVVWVGGPEFK